MEMTDALAPEGTLLPLQQSPEFARALRHMGRRARFQTLRDDDGGRLGHVVLISRRIAGLGWLRFTSSGPIWAPQIPALTRRRALRFLRAQGMLVANAGADDARCFANAGYRRIMTPATVAQLPLCADWRAYAQGKWRNQLASARRRGAVRISQRRFDVASDLWLLNEAQNMARARGYRDLPPTLTLAYAAAWPKAARLFVARAQTRVVAAVLILRHGAVASYHIGWSNAEGRAANAHRLLLAEAADWLVAQGCQRLDLGTLDTAHAPGLARFKLGMGAQALRLGGSWAALPLSLRLV